MTKFLGVLLDQHLSWKYHINHVAKKVSKTIGTISKAHFFLSSKSLLSLYYALVYPYLNYCNIAWCSLYPSNSNRILYLQKRIVRIICEAEYLGHAAPLFQTLKILNFFNINAFFVVCFMHSYIIITSFLKRLTPPLLLIANYTNIILEMLITTDPISVEQTLNSSQSTI